MPLITADQLKARLKDYTGTAQDDVHADLIDRADALMAAYCGFPHPDGATAPTLVDATYTFYLDGPSSRHPRRLKIPMRPIVSVTSLHDDPDWDYGAADLIDSSGYVLDAEAGVLWLRADSGEAFSRSPRAQKIVVVAGFADPLADGHLLVELCALTVRHLISAPQRLGLQSMSSSGTTQTLAEQSDLLPRSVRMGLGEYRLGGALAG